MEGSVHPPIHGKHTSPNRYAWKLAFFLINFNVNAYGKVNMAGGGRLGDDVLNGWIELHYSIHFS
jgi:hypothetical protein